MRTIDFWYEFASTYSYVTAMRIARVAAKARVAVRWRPFLLGPIFKDFGWNDSPFNIFPAKGRYMWRDFKRVCDEEDLQLELPPVRFPQNGLKAARLALSGVKDGWAAEFSRRVFMANYAEQRDIADDRTLRDILEQCSLDPDGAIEAANAPTNKEALFAQTAEAKSRGIFGAPSFTVGEELFWGNDRLETALRWAKAQS